MNKLTVQQAAEKWNISVRRVQDYCRLGKIPGAERIGLNWIIPADAIRPVDGRSKTAKLEAQRDIPMPRKSPFLDMTDLYSEPGTANKCIFALSSNPEAQALFSAEIAYRRGEIDSVYSYVQYFFDKHSGLYSVIGSGMLLALCAMWTGDINMWRRARKHICEAPVKNSTERDILALSLAATDSAIRATEDFPEWFKRGCFESLPADAHPAAMVYYLKYLIVYAQELATGELKLQNIRGLGLMRCVPYIAEPMITAAQSDGYLIPEIYLRLMCAIACQQCGDTERATYHLDKAIKYCLADDLFGLLAEHRRQLGKILDERLAIVDPYAVKRVKDLHKRLQTGWTIIHNSILERTVNVALTLREREIARLAVFGLTDKQIANQLDMPESQVKSMLKSAKEKTGVEKRSDLAMYI